MHNITLCWSPLWQHGWSGIYHRLVSPIPYGYILHILFLCSYMAKTIFGCFFSPWGHLIDLIGSAEEFPLFTTQDNLCKNASKHAHNCTFFVTNIRNLTTKTKIPFPLFALNKVTCLRAWFAKRNGFQLPLTIDCCCEYLGFCYIKSWLASRLVMCFN